MTRHTVLVAALALAAAGCDETLRDVAGPSPNLTPTFSSIQTEIFSATDEAGRTACTTCHNPQGARSNNLDLTQGASYNQLVNVPSTTKPGAVRVIPGDPENSYLIHKIEGRPGIVGERMPRNAGPFLTPGQISIIRRWIELGAQDN